MKRPARREVNRVYNRYFDALDTLITGSLSNTECLVFVHGFGSDKNEGFDLFEDISNMIEKHLQVTIIRFDFSGYGLSQGRQEDACLNKMTADLQTVLDFAKIHFDNISILAHSFGTYVVSNLQPTGIKW